MGTTCGVVPQWSFLGCAPWTPLYIVPLALEAKKALLGYVGAGRGEVTGNGHLS